MNIFVTQNGIQAIEMNFRYGIDHLQCTYGGMRRVLNVYPNNIL